jgi:uncharacterized membrane protein YedE/YeeE
MKGAGFAFGSAFGFVITAAGLNNYDVIHRMLLLEELDVYFIMASAIAVAAPLIWILERRRVKTVLGGPIVVERGPVRRNNVLGAVMFGAGWAIAGACPGPAIGMAVAGHVPALAVIAGLMTGVVARDRLAGQPSNGGQSVATIPERPRAPVDGARASAGV